MAYTVKKLAAMSGVSVRTPHLYDELGLLKPAHRGANGYRFYEEAQILTLQQILFYRELGFELKEIKRILGRPSFDRIAALESHRKLLQQKLAQTRELLQTIDRTIEHLKGTRTMKSDELFAGFSPEEQARHEQYLVKRFGPGVEEHIAQSKARVKDWTRADWEKVSAAFAGICKDLVKLMEQKVSVDLAGVQEVIGRHYQWLKQFWTPNRKSYAGYSQLVVDSDLRKAYASHHPDLPEFAAAAMRCFAEAELP